MKRLVFIILFLNSLCSFSNPEGLIVGVIGGAPPFSEESISSSGTFFFGFSIDIMDSICKDIKMKCTYQKVEFDTQLASLDNGHVDVLLLTYPYDLTKFKQYAMSLPYVLSKVHFIALKNSPIRNDAAIKNFKIGVVKTTFYNLLKNSSYAANNQIIAYNNVTDLITGLTNHKIDLIVLNSSIAASFMNNSLYSIKTIGPEFELGEGYGIITLQDNEALIKDINKAIINMQTDGTYLAIFRKYYD